jgi:hypothetical protein
VRGYARRQVRDSGFIAGSPAIGGRQTRNTTGNCRPALGGYGLEVNSSATIGPRPIHHGFGAARGSPGVVGSRRINLMLLMKIELSGFAP